MRKRLIGGGSPGTSADDREWIDLEPLVQVELTSEDPDHPVEAALVTPGGGGWRAQQTGKQTIRLRFDEPQRISLIQLVFQEQERQRTQEFLLRWSRDGGTSWQEIVRQQYNFSPPDNSQPRGRGVRGSDSRADAAGTGYCPRHQWRRSACIARRVAHCLTAGGNATAGLVWLICRMISPYQGAVQHVCLGLKGACPSSGQPLPGQQNVDPHDL